VALFERAVGLYGELIDINAYHQPGVEAGKKAAAKILDLQERLEQLLQDGKLRSVEQVSQELGESTSPEAVFFILRHLCGNDRGLQVSGNWSDPLSLQFKKA
jgi:glucose-6-phosphate isomerase